jgi:hypothetical protein
MKNDEAIHPIKIVGGLVFEFLKSLNIRAGERNQIIPEDFHVGY